MLGDRWFPFVASARAVLGSESGASAIDRRGELVAAERTMLAEQPCLDFADFDAAMPAGWDGQLPGSVGPRHLEAAAARTCQVLVEGGYDGVLEPDVHYLPVRPDGSNADAVVERLADHKLVEATATRAYADLVLSGRYGYAALAAQLERVLDEERPAGRRAIRRLATPCSDRRRRLQRGGGASAPLGVQGGRSRRPRAHPAPRARARALVPARSAAPPPVILSARGPAARAA